MDRLWRVSIINWLPSIVVKVDLEGKEEAINGTLINSDLWCSEEMICFIETWAHALKMKLQKALNGRILVRPKNQMKWLDLRKLGNLENATELHICNAQLPKQDNLKFCKWDR